MNNTFELTSDFNVRQIIENTRREAVENQEFIDESFSDIMKTTTLSFLLAIPGLVSAEDLNKGLDSENNKVVEISSPKVQKKIYNILGKDRTEKAIMINIIARTLMAEACGEKSRKSFNAIATVIWNRADGDKNKFIDVIFKPKQFSCWNKFNNSDKTNFIIRPHRLAATNPSSWDYCVKVATQMVNGTFVPLNSWTHYYAQNSCTPSWSKNLKNKTTIGNHTFGIA